jgi:hypothetical protein
VRGKRLRHPVRALREPFGKAGLILAVCAIVLALTGAAFAAGALTGKQKKEVEKIAKKFSGKRGPAGPAGANGAAGAQGPAGPAGAAGKEGPQGKEGKQGLEGKQGPEGSPWTAGGTLPSGETETGSWAFISGPEQPTFHLVFGKSPISFPIPIASPGDEVETLTVNLLEMGEKETAACPGEFKEPKAEPGQLCVYTQVALDTGPLYVDIPANSSSSKIIWGGTVFSQEGEEGGYAAGSFAVTAP